MTPSFLPSWPNAVARLPDLHRMGPVTVAANGSVAVCLPSGRVQVWRRVRTTKVFELVVP